MADTKQYIIGTSDQAGKLKHKDYTEWVDSITGTVVKAPGTSSTDKANGTIISLASNLDELENTRIYDAIDIEWAPYKIKHYNNGSTVEEPLRTTSDVINNINNLYTYSTTSSYNFSNAYNNLKSYVLTTYNNTKTAHNNLNSYVLTTYNNVKTSYDNLYTYVLSANNNINSNVLTLYNNLNSYVLTTYNNVKTAYDNLKSYVLTTYNNIKTSYNNLYTYVLTSYDNLKAYVLTTYNNVRTSYNNLNSYILTTYNNVKTSHNNLNSYVLTTYNNVKNSYDNLKAYVLTTYNNVKTSYDNLYTYVLTLSTNSSSSNNDIKTAYNNLYSYVLTTYNNVKTSYNNLYSYTTSKCANIESKINNLDVSAGNYKSTLGLNMMSGAEANKNNTVSVITGITQTDGKISYAYSGLYVTPTLINSKGGGKFITEITSTEDNGIFDAYKGNIDIKPGTSTTGNAITGLSVNEDGDIVYEKETTFVTNTQLNNLDVSAGNYDSIVHLPIKSESEANQNTTQHIITGITQTNGKISYSYSGLYISPITILDEDVRAGKFITSISVLGGNSLYTHRGIISASLDPNSNNIGNAITNLGVNGVGDILYEKTIVFADVNSKNTFTDDQTATAWYVSSDINYKEIIDDCKITIDEISKLPIFDYIWKLDEEKKIHTGSSAQAVEEILPNLVTEDNEGVKSLDYASLGAIAGILACREICKLRDKIDKLDKIIENKL